VEMRRQTHFDIATVHFSALEPLGA
jgi:hypothetical protein